VSTTLTQWALSLGWFGTLADKPFRGAEESRVKRDLAGGMDCVDLPEVDPVGCHLADACGLVVLVMAGKELVAESADLVDRIEIEARRLKQER
jgi:hypothetical protein